MDKQMGKLGVVVVAAGKGSRMGTAESKQYLTLRGKPIIVRTLEVFAQMPEISEIVWVTGPDGEARCREYIREYEIAKIRHIVPGGGERQHSVYAGLNRLQTEWVLVHDGVRPFVSPALAAACWREAMKHGAAILAVPVKDTVKIVDSENLVTSTPDRKSLWAAQTPQAFRRVDLLRAHEEAARAGYIGTDDAALAERIGIPVKVVPGDYHNIKITTPEDLQWAESIIGDETK